MKIMTREEMELRKMANMIIGDYVDIFEAGSSIDDTVPCYVFDDRSVREANSQNIVPARVGCAAGVTKYFPKGLGQGWLVGMFKSHRGNGMKFVPFNENLHFV